MCRRLAGDRRVIVGSMSFPRGGVRGHNAGMSIREMRRRRGWSQEQLAERSGLSVRTIQRIENGQRPGPASAGALAGAFEVDVTDIVEPAAPAAPVGGRQDAFGSVRTCLRRYADFDGTSSRAEYWWFFGFVMLAGSLATLVGPAFGTAVLLVLLLPLVAAGARRLHDEGYSGWWQLFALAPFGFVVPMILMAWPSSDRA